MTTISIPALQATASEDVCLIDVRSAGEFAGEHAEGAINLPLDALTAERVQGVVDSRTVVHILCQSGTRARMAADKLGAIDGLELRVVEGGTNAWKAAGLPIVTGKGVISIERQVRIGAGALVAAGVALGHFVDPGFLGISAFVGCGLIFAGVTDFCGMGLMLAKMPWNRRACASC